LERPLFGMIILLVEDDALLALDTADQLYELGATEVAMAESVQTALQIIRDRPIAIALLDVGLQNENSNVVADALHTRKIRFGFATGYSELDQLPSHLRNIPVIRKPFSSNELRLFIIALTTSPFPHVNPECC
jgi:DNA-binding NtrC family response regulator